MTKNKLSKSEIRIYCGCGRVALRYWPGGEKKKKPSEAATTLVAGKATAGDVA